MTLPFQDRRPTSSLKVESPLLPLPRPPLPLPPLSLHLLGAHAAPVGPPGENNLKNAQKGDETGKNTATRINGQ